jgi:hypothetical protein
MFEDIKEVIRSMKISKRSSEAVYLTRTDNTMTKGKDKMINNDLQNIMQKHKTSMVAHPK